MQSIFYLDTSGLNYLADNVREFGFLDEMKKHLKFELYLSPVVLWEIFLNSDEGRRDELIYWAQFNCSGKLLKSPAEIVVDYIRLGCPEKDIADFRREPFSRSEMASVWGGIHKKLDRTIPVDIDMLKGRTDAVRNLSRRLKGIIGRMCDEASDRYEEDPFHQAMIDTFARLDGKNRLAKKMREYRKLH